MDQEVLVREKLDATGRVLLELQDIFPLNVSFLVAMEDSESPMLYIVLEDSDQADAVYRAILRIANEKADPNFDPFSVTVVGADDPMAQSALKFIAKHGKFFSTHTSGKIFGQAGVDRAYIYGSPLTPAHVG